MKPQRTLAAFLAFALLTLRPEAGPAQRSGTSAYERARASLPAPQRTVFTNIVTSARARGLPIDPLVDKALEGRAKRISPDRIIAVVRMRADQLTRAQGIARSKSPAELIAVADALQRGVDEKTIRTVRASARSNEPVGLAVHTLADLLESGVPPEVALGVIAGWRSRGATVSELRELPAAVDRLVRAGASPANAGSAVASALRSGRAASSVRMAVELRGNAKAPGVSPNSGRTAASAARSPNAASSKLPAAAKATPKNNIKGQ